MWNLGAKNSADQNYPVPLPAPAAERGAAVSRGPRSRSATRTLDPDPRGGRSRTARIGSGRLRSSNSELSNGRGGQSARRFGKFFAARQENRKCDLNNHKQSGGRASVRGHCPPAGRPPHPAARASERLPDTRRPWVGRPTRPVCVANRSRRGASSRYPAASRWTVRGRPRLKVETAGPGRCLAPRPWE